jgi:glycine betaine/proline transport system substrate-binding protein
MTRRIFGMVAAAAAAAALSCGQPANADVPESTDPIRIVQNNWTSQLVLSNVVGQLLQKMGYNVEYKPSDTQLQYQAIANGDMDF